MSLKLFKSLFIIALGTAIMAFGIINFSVTSNLASGGLTGITLILYHVFGLSTGLTTLLLNIPLLIVYYRYTNRSVLLLTIYGIASLSAFLRLFELIGPLMPDLNDHMIIAVIGFGVTVGLGTGIILQQEGTTGGAAIVGKLLKDIWNIPVAKTFLVFDSIVITASALFFASLLDVMYSLISLYITTVVLTKVLEGFVAGYKVLIFSDRYEEIAKYIQAKLDRGVTFVRGVGAYSKEEKNVVLTIVGKKQLTSLKKGVYDIDPHSFVTVSHTYETLGEGFTFEKNDESRREQL